MKRNQITYQRVRELFDYDNRGYLIRLQSRNNKALKGSIAGCYCKDGYYKVMVDRKFYKVHTLIFLYHNGFLPEGDIDHIDKDSTNNKIENLREVSRRCNIINSKMFSTNTSGIKGVCRDTARDRWAPKIKINKQTKSLGRFDCIVEAAAHRLAAEQCLGYDLCERSSAFQTITNYINREKNAKEI